VINQLDLTDRQRQVLRAILEYQLRHGMPPTLEALGDRLGIHSKNGVVMHLKALLRRGYLVSSRGRFGTLRLVGVEWHPVFDSEMPQGLLLAELYRETTGESSAAMVVPGEVLG